MSQKQAIQLINACITSQNPYLDLGNCGLRDSDVDEGTEIDRLLRQCTHLEALVWSSNWQAWADTENSTGSGSQNKGTANFFNTYPPAVSSLSRLKQLIMGGDIVTKCQISQIDFLESLTQLEHLDLSNNKIEEIKGLETLTALRVLDLSGNQISRLQGLEINKGLHILNLNNNQIREIKGLDTLLNLKTLYLSGNQIADIKGLESLSLLHNLDLSRNQITEIKGLVTLTSLRSLNMFDNQIIEIKGLETLSNLIELKLFNNQIIEIKGLDNLSKLNNLILAENRITEIKGLSTLKNLQVLYLYGNRISEIKELEGLHRIKDLNLWNNQISEIKGLEEMRDLNNLAIGDNQIKEMKGLESLHKIKNLYLNGNHIKEIKQLQHLVELRSLNLGRNQISKITGLEKLTALSSLDLNSNQITELKGLAGLSALSDLQLSFNKIDKFKGLEGLTALSSLNLSYNRISEINDLEHLTALSSLYLAGNPLIEKYGWSNDGNHLALAKEWMLRQQSEEITITFPVKVLMLGNHGSGKSSLVNAITGGKHSGSTHILRIENYKIEKREKKKSKEQEKKLALPDAIFYDFGGQDFYHGLYQAFMNPRGLEGQAGLQLLLFHNATDKNEFAKDKKGLDIVNYHRSYWLGQKKYRGNTDPYIVVQTYADTDKEAKPVNCEDYHGYQQGFYLSLANDAELPADKKRLADFYKLGRNYCKLYVDEQIGRLQAPQKTAGYFARLLASIINREGRNHEPTPLKMLLKDYEIPKTTEAQRLESLQTNLQQLSHNGLVLYYKLPQLADVVWLHPEALVKYIQEEVLAKHLITQGKGVVSKADFEKKVLPDGKLRQLLLLQKLVFLHRPGNGRDEYIIPNYLPLALDSDPDYQLFVFGLMQPDFVLKFNDFIPFGYINQLICFFGKQPDAKKFWRNQLLFTLHKEARVLIQIDFATLQVKVHLQLLPGVKSSKRNIVSQLFYSMLALYFGEWDDSTIGLVDDVHTPEVSNDVNPFSLTGGFFANSYLGKLISEIKQNQILQKTAEDLTRNFLIKMKENESYIPHDAYLSVDGHRFISYAALFNIPEGQYRLPAYTLNPEDGRINKDDVKEVAVNPFAPFSHKPLRGMKKIFISYSQKDTRLQLTNGVEINFKDELETHLKQLTRLGLATVWSDTNLLAGDDWDTTIKAQMEDADIILFLVTANLIATEYVWNEEMPLSQYVKEHKQTKIIPVILSDCLWVHFPLFSEANALPQKGEPVVNFPNREKAWHEVTSKIRQLLVPEATEGQGAGE